MALSDLLVAAQQRDAGQKKNAEMDSLRDQIVLARTPANPLSPPDLLAATIATMDKVCDVMSHLKHVPAALVVADSGSTVDGSESVRWMRDASLHRSRAMFPFSHSTRD